MRSKWTPVLPILLLLLPIAAQAQAPGVYAITGATVHPANGPDIVNGTVLIRDGLIEAVGANVAIPPDAAVIDAKGAHVYPGLIDAQTSLGFPSARPQTRRRGGGGQRGAQQEQLPETSPAYIAMRNVNLTDDDIDAARGIGVTTIVTAPAFGIFNGQSAVLNLGTGTAEERVIKSPAAMQISFNPRPAWTFPDSLMGVIAYIRQTMLDAQWYSSARAVYDKNPTVGPRPETSESLEAMQPVIAKNLPVVFVADGELMIRRAQKIASEFGLRYIISGGRQGYRFADDLKAANVPVLVSVKWPIAPTSKEDREEQPLRVIRDRQLAPTTPSVFVKSGVTFALVSGAGKTGDFIPGIRKAMDNGLSADDALKATTIWPARIFGVDRQLGSLEHGKIANVVVSDKPIFDKEAKITREFVDGREVRLPSPDKKAGESAPSAVDGTWRLTVRSSQGDVAVTVTLHNENGALTGTFSGDKGSGDIRNGSFDGTTVEFTVAVKGQSETESSDWVFHGTLDGTSMSGSVTTSLGTVQFTGSKGR
jgi:imidazolonepropionase-like amidohydrolase